MRSRPRRLVCLFLVLVMTLSAAPIQAASKTSAPRSPQWWPADDYLVFEGDPLYESSLWPDILVAREEVSSGKSLYNDNSTAYYRVMRHLSASGDSAATAYELALLDMGLFLTGSRARCTNARRSFSDAANRLETDDPDRRVLTVWSLRCMLLDRCLQDDSDYGKGVRSSYLYNLDRAMADYGVTLEELCGHPIMANVSQADLEDITVKLAEYRVQTAAAAQAERQRLKIYLDGRELRPDGAKPCIIQDRTMVPIYYLTGPLGADVTWTGETQTVELQRAGRHVQMTINSKTAYIDGSAITMDVAPCIVEDRTLIPAAYVALFFGQKVEWDGATSSVYITEDKSAAGGSNLEAWALPMGAMLSHINSRSPAVFGGDDRALSYESNSLTDPSYHKTITIPGSSRELLSEGWNINSREQLIHTILVMTVAGHNDNFLYDASLVNSLSASEYRQLLSKAQGMDAYMWPYTKQLSEKWGDRGILCWDLFRMSNLVQWGYTAGYLTYTEALVLLEPAAALLKENFPSWDEAYENYLDGYNWWARNDVLGKDIWDTPRGRMYTITLKNSYGDVFDDSLFETGVIPVPDLTIDDILAKL